VDPLEEDSREVDPLVEDSHEVEDHQHPFLYHRHQ
jgi:hypothetical protein